MKTYTYNKTEIRIAENGKFYICPKGADIDIFPSERANFEIKLFGERQLNLSDDDFVFTGCKETKSGVVLSYTNKREGLEVTVCLDASEGVITQTNTVKNIGDEIVKLTSFSSAYIEGIASGEGKPWYDRDVCIHICYNKWQSEGQWESFSPRQLGLQPATSHNWERESYKINSVGSWSTGIYYPLVIVEDKEAGAVWFLETEGAHNWFIKLASYGGYNEPNLSLEASSCDETNGGWYYDLIPGEEYSTERVMMGAVDGGFEEAAECLNRFKRCDATVGYSKKRPYVIFNDYMDCIWSMQEPERIIPLAEAAAKVGCEIFCIDGGWYQNKGALGLGDWVPKEQYYSQTTLGDLAKKISKLGLIPGIWFEFDANTDTSYVRSLNDDMVIRRYDKAVGGERSFYNFKNPKVREHLISRVEEFYNMGYRFIKNDYNKSIGIGCTNNYDGESPAQGAIENANAFYDFIDELYRRFPELIMENCGSGALRSDNKTLKRFSLQSSSDQEFYFNNPSIVMGTMLQMPPEKAGIWSYPYPVMFEGRETFELTDEYVEKMADGYETSFNMVTSMMGAMYLSGRIDLCDEKNFKLVKDGVDFYKKIRDDISNSRPVFPLGLCRINEKCTTALGLLSDKKLLLAVWNINTGKEAEIKIDLSKYLYNDICISGIYPQLDGVEAKADKKELIVNLPSENSAIMLEIER